MESDFDIILIAAGLSTRLCGKQKVLHKFCGHTLLFYSLSNALRTSNVILVIGHMGEDVKKEALRIRESGKFKNNLKIAYNDDYVKGQYSSIITGIKHLAFNRPFAVSLSDMPFVKQSDYINIYNELEDNSIIRPFVNENPTHPVFFNSTMKEFLLKNDNFNNMREVIDSFQNDLKIKNLNYKENPKMCIDFDKEEDFKLYENAVDWT